MSIGPVHNNYPHYVDSNGELTYRIPYSHMNYGKPAVGDKLYYNDFVGFCIAKYRFAPEYVVTKIVRGGFIFSKRYVEIQPYKGVF